MKIHLGMGIIFLLSLVFSHSSRAATSDDAVCGLPDALQRDVANRYPTAHVVALSDLGDDDRALFLKDHGNTCPGVSKLDFYGDGRPTFALSLLSSGEHGKRALLVVAHQVGDRWTETRIDAADSSTPVIWNEKPGEYTDVHGKKKLRATRPAVVWCVYESWAVLYARTGSTVSKIWVSD